ncbi:MAG: type II and III secretion system protein family protein [Planctomycetota bacterium]|nr:type II and III secretion system protein family protein [Planctomycetota bacterium]
MSDPKKNTNGASSRRNGLGRKAVLAMSTILAFSSLQLSGAMGDGTPTAPLPDTRPVVFASEMPSSAPEQNATTEPSDQGLFHDSGTLLLEPGKARKISMGHKIKRANILLPDIADVIPLGPSELLLSAKKGGTTQLVVWDETDHSQIINVTVESDIEALRHQLKTLFVDSKIAVDEVGGTVTLRGQVSSLQTADDAAKVAAPYGTKVVNLLEVAGEQQVLLHVRFAEVSKTASAQLGVNFGFSDGKSFFGSNVGQVNAFGTLATNAVEAISSPSPGSNVALFGQGAVGKAVFQYFISALETNNLLRMLAEPDLVATSGQEASFQAGGSFPIPVPQAGSGGTGSTITIQFQDYGVLLHFTPVVLGNGRIRLKVHPEVSQLDFANAVNLNGFFVPGLTKRDVKTTVELSEGQTFAIAGLLQNSISASNQQLPGLGDLPVLGALFRSVQYKRNETELIVLVTPEIVGAMDPSDVTEVPGGRWRDPKERDLYLKKDLGGPLADTDRAPRTDKEVAPRFHGSYGFRPADDTTAPAVK